MRRGGIGREHVSTLEAWSESDKEISRMMGSYLARIPACKISLLQCCGKGAKMLAKKTSKNQVTLPKKVLQEIPDTDYFDVTTKNGVLILKPVTVSEAGARLATIRQKIKDLGIEPEDVDRAIAWARGRRGRRR